MSIAIPCPPAAHAATIPRCSATRKLKNLCVVMYKTEI